MLIVLYEYKQLDITIISYRPLPLHAVYHQSFLKIACGQKSIHYQKTPYHLKICEIFSAIH